MSEMEWEELEAGDDDRVRTELERLEVFSGEWKKLEIRERDAISVKRCTGKAEGNEEGETQICMGRKKRQRACRTPVRSGDPRLSQLLSEKPCFQVEAHEHELLSMRIRPSERFGGETAPIDPCSRHSSHILQLERLSYNPSLI